MPPPMPNPSKRFKANPIRPARYRPGKAVPEEESTDEDEEEETEEVRKAATKKQPHAPLRRPQVPVQEDDDVDEDGFVTEEDDDATSAPAPAQGGVPVRSTPAAHLLTRAQPVTTQSAAESEPDGEESEEESEEEESSEQSSSEDEAPQRIFQRPTFIKRSERQKSADGVESGTFQALPAATSTLDLDQQNRRLAQAELYIKDKLERDALARSQGRKAWDDDEELAPEDTVDDTDNLDPQAEYAAWKLRELKRLKRDREAIEAREKEIEELERRRNLTQEERDAEDREYIARQKEDRDEGRGKANYLAKYHHKGAFFQDDEMAEILKKRDIMGARFEDEVSDKTALPEYMRVRDMTKLGKKGRTRYTDLKGEDTGRFGEDVKRWRGAGYQNDNKSDTVDLRGVDERFLPDDDRRPGRDGNRNANGPTGANASIVGQRREFIRKDPRPRSRSRSRSRSPARQRHDDDREGGDSYRPRRRSYSYSSQSRSRTPPRRKRSPSPYADREKRRRVEVDR